MDQVANDLFGEWEKEISEFTNPTYASNSRRQLNETRTKYQQLAASVKSAESSMEPVLKQLKEQVLYLKHNLNAAAIGSLRGEATNIQAEITRLLDQMNSRSPPRACGRVRRARSASPPAKDSEHAVV